MANDPEHSESNETVVDIPKEEIVAGPDEKSSDAATSSSGEEASEEHGKKKVTVTEEMAKIWRKMKKDNKDAATKQEKWDNMKTKLQGFRQRNVDEIQSYCENQRKSRGVDRGHRGSGFYKVPDDMRQRQGREGLYDPTHINFSEIKDLLKKDDPVPKHYYHHFLGIYEGNPRNKLEDYILMIYEDRQKIARCYGVKEADLDFPQLLGLLLGSCFVIYLFYLSFRDNTLSSENECECLHQWVNDLWVDLLLLENQIPFCLLESVFFKFKDRESLEDYANIYFREFVPLHLTGKNHQSVHLLDFVHRSLLPDKRSDHRSFFPNLPIFSYFFTELLRFGCSIHEFLWRNTIARLLERPVRRVIPTATRLKEAGVRFRAVERKGFVVEFKRGILRLPRLHIEKNTKQFFLNLIAWEHCHQPAAKYVINFVILMDRLINTSKDVEILIHNNVLEHSLANEEAVATMFNSLGKDLIYTKNKKNNRKYDFLIQLSTELNKFCESRFSNWWAKLMIEYFSSPWTILSLIAALFLLLLTLVQAYFSAYSYFYPPK